MSEIGETPNQKQSRLRRERRNAKIAAGGSARLAAIMNSSGRQHAADAETARPITPMKPGPATPDPDVMDISEHHYEPRTTPRSPMPAFEIDPQAQQMRSGDDPMMAMLQQMLTGGGAPGAPGNAGQVPPGLEQMFGGGGGGGPGGEPGMAEMLKMLGGGASTGGFPGFPEQDQQNSMKPPSSFAYVWRILHFFISLSLALYVTLNTTFNGSKRARDLSSLTYNAPLSQERNFGTQLFYLFATAEVVLQSSRYFIEKGQLAPSGIMGTLSAVLPPPWAGYLRTIGRYSIIYTTVVADAMVVVFVLGMMAWWKNGALDVSSI